MLLILDGAYLFICFLKKGQAYLFDKVIALLE